MANWFDHGSADPFDRYMLLKSMQTKQRAKAPVRSTGSPTPTPPASASQSMSRKPAPHVYRHGDQVEYRYDAVIGRGTIVGSSRDWVLIRHVDGREHRVAHEALLPPVPFRRWV